MGGFITAQPGWNSHFSHDHPVCNLKRRLGSRLIVWQRWTSRVPNLTFASMDGGRATVLFVFSVRLAGIEQLPCKRFSGILLISPATQQEGCDSWVTGYGGGGEKLSKAAAWNPATWWQAGAEERLLGSDSLWWAAAGGCRKQGHLINKWTHVSLLLGMSYR